MSGVATVFKFCSAAGGAAILRNNCIFVTSPLDLNDPFEMRPAWTNVHQERHCQNELKRNSLVDGMPAFAAKADGKLAPIGKTPPLPEPQRMDVNDQLGLADQHNQEAFQLLHQRYRVLSFCTQILDLARSYNEGDEKQTLMWSHYADMFQGLCLAIDSTKLCNGIKNEGYLVDYDPIRRSLPPSFYDTYLSMERERVKMHGIEFSKDPESKLFLMDHSREEKLEEKLLDFLRHKSPAWEYEREVRMIYEVALLRKSGDYRRLEFPCEPCKIKKKGVEQCDHTTYRDAVRLPPEAIQAVILGTDTSLAALRELFNILDDSRYAHVPLFWSSLHSERYIIQYSRSDRSYVECIQKLRTENVAYAKWHLGQKGLLPSGKGVNYTMKKAADKSHHGIL